MKVFYDTEFHEDGRTIDLLSIGLVREDRTSYYAVVSDADWDAVRKDPWLVNKVWPQMPVRGMTTGLVTVGDRNEIRVKNTGTLDTDDVCVKPKWVIANEVRDFLQQTPNLELWAYYAAYDHVALAQLWGPMIHLPGGVPMWTNDLKQEWVRQRGDEVPADADGAHHALGDAKWNLRLAEDLGLMA